MDRKSLLRIAAKIGLRVAERHEPDGGFLVPEKPGPGVRHIPSEPPSWEGDDAVFEDARRIMDGQKGPWAEDGVSPFIKSNYTLDDITECWYTCNLQVLEERISAEFDVNVTIPDTIENMKEFQRKNRSDASVLVVFPDVDFFLQFGEDEDRPLYQWSHQDGKADGPNIEDVMPKHHSWLQNLKGHGTLVTNAQFDARLKEHKYPAWKSSRW